MQKTAAMLSSSFDFLFLSTEERTEMLVRGEQPFGKCRITYPSYPGFVMYTTRINGKKEGSGILEDEHGYVLIECNYHDDLLKGTLLRYSKNGALMEMGHCVNGTREGIFQMLDEEGNRKEVSRYCYGRLFSKLSALPSPPGYWEERSVESNQVLSVAKYTPDFSSMDGLCYVYEDGKVNREEVFSEGGVRRVITTFNERVKTVYDNEGKTVFVGEYKDEVSSFFPLEGRVCEFEDGKAARVDKYKNGERDKKWKEMKNGLMTEFDEKGEKVYVGEYSENPECFCTRNGRGEEFEKGVLKRVVVFTNDSLERVEREFKNTLMKEYNEEGELVYWGGYVRKENGDIYRNGIGTVFINGAAVCSYIFNMGELEESIDNNVEDSLLEDWNCQEDESIGKENASVGVGEGSASVDFDEENAFVGFEWNASVGIGKENTSVNSEGNTSPSISEQKENGTAVEMPIEPKTTPKETDSVGSTSNTRENCITIVVTVLSLLLACAIGLSYFFFPAITPFLMEVCVMEVAYMCYLYSAKNNEMKYCISSVTSLAVLIFSFYLAITRLDSWLYVVMCVLLGMEIITVIVLLLKLDKAWTIFYAVICLASFIGWCIVTLRAIGSPPFYSYILLCLWYGMAVFVFPIKDSYCVYCVSALCLLVCHIISCFVNHWFFFVILALIEVIVLFFCIVSVSEHIERQHTFYPLFLIDLGLFIWWCSVVVPASSLPFLSFTLFIWWFAFAAYLCIVCVQHISSLNALILLATVVCILGSTWVFIWKENTVFYIISTILNTCLLVVVGSINGDLHGNKNKKEKWIGLLLFWIDCVVILALFILCMVWLYATKETPIPVYPAILMILSASFILFPLGVSFVVKNKCLVFIHFILLISVFAFSWYLVRYSTQFVPYVWLYGIALFPYFMLYIV